MTDKKTGCSDNSFIRQVEEVFFITCKYHHINSSEALKSAVVKAALEAKDKGSEAVIDAMNDAILAEREKP